MSLLRALLLPLLLLASLGAEDAEQAYSAWSQGRIDEAIPLLHAAAQGEDRWDRWCDLGLAAAAAGDPGRAAAWLLEAHRRAPGAEEPLQALAALGSELPPSWSARLGPLALPGASLAGPLLLALGAACCAYAAVGRRRQPTLGLGLLLLLIALPGQLARQLDATRELLAVVRPSHLLDSTGAPIEDAALPPGTILARDGGRPWAGRIAVRLGDGRAGWIPEGDLTAEP